MASSTPLPPKKPAPIPWSHTETQALIQSYQNKWYTLKRGQLKASQWEEVASSVADLCIHSINEFGNNSNANRPSKTALQCRHKMEKLRKRYRSERISLPSSWPYFHLMDQMERGPFPINARPINSIAPPPRDGVERRGDQSDDYDSDVDKEEEEEEKKVVEVEEEDVSRSRSINHILRRGGQGEEGLVPRDNHLRGWGVQSKGQGVENSGSGSRMMSPLLTPWTPKDKGLVVEKEVIRGWVRDKSPMVEKEVPRGVRMKEPRNRVSPPIGRKRVEEEREGEKSGGGGGEVFSELATVIRAFGEGYVRVEKMRMDMMKEMERYRREMENKRTEMILQSQKNIMEALVEAVGPRKRYKRNEEM